MPCQSCAPYRGFKVDVQVTTGKTLRLHSAGRRYKVSWIIRSFDESAEKIAGFPERLEFISEQDAIRYAEGRAHTFIDGMLSANLSIYSEGKTTYAPERRAHPEA
jgi:hypothetical protein